MSFLSQIMKPRYPYSLGVTRISLTDFIELDEWVSIQFGDRVKCADRQIVQSKHRGYGDNPISKWDMIKMTDQLTTRWHFKNHEDLMYFILRYSDILSEYEYRIHNKTNIAITDILNNNHEDRRT